EVRVLRVQVEKRIENGWPMVRVEVADHRTRGEAGEDVFRVGDELLSLGGSQLRHAQSGGAHLPLVVPGVADDGIGQHGGTRQTDRQCQRPKICSNRPTLFHTASLRPAHDYIRTEPDAKKAAIGEPRRILWRVKPQ